MNKKLLLAFSIIPLNLLASTIERPFGYESVTGVRSAYIHRGVKLADTTMDFQFHGIYTYEKGRDLEYGAWYAGETNSGDFSEMAVTMKYIETVQSWTYSVGFQYRYIDHDLINSGAELDVGFEYELNRDNLISSMISYDTSANGWYADLSYKCYKDINERSFLSYNLGVSFAHNYYDRDGFNDIHSRISYTFNVNDFVSLSPFLGASHTDEDDTQVFGGLWFEVSF